MAKATLLLPPRACFTGQPLPTPVAAALGRADRMPDAVPGERAQLLRHFELLPHGWPIASLTRQSDAGDAALSAWLRADPAWVRPDINGVRLLACGDALQLTQQDVDALLPALRPLFGDAGFLIDAPVPSRWYLRLPREVELPIFAEPAEALGADLFDHLPQGGEGEGGTGRRWRALLSEAQVLLHNHPWNAQRAAAGRPPVNSLWFWGGGILPDHVATAHAWVQSEECVLRALAAAASVQLSVQSPRFELTQGDALIDLRTSHDAASLAHDWLMPAITALQGGRLERLLLDFADGGGFRLERRQRWRFWRKPRAALDTSRSGIGNDPEPA
ncbi:MAG: phosphoglycerate mutase [Luteimonas sp.]